MNGWLLKLNMKIWSVFSAVIVLFDMGSHTARVCVSKGICLHSKEDDCMTWAHIKLPFHRMNLKALLHKSPLDSPQHENNFKLVILSFQGFFLNPVTFFKTCWHMKMDVNWQSASSKFWWWIGQRNKLIQTHLRRWRESELMAHFTQLTRMH